MFKTSNNKTTFEELSLFAKHGAEFRGTNLNFTFKLSDKELWSSVTFADDLVLSKEQIEAHIDFMRTSLSVDGTFETALQLGGVVFPSGQAFEDWMSDKQMELSSLKQEEIIQ